MHHLSKDNGVNQNHGQRIDYSPARTEKRSLVFELKLALDAA
jgi:hypothetical protein